MEDWFYDDLHRAQQRHWWYAARRVILGDVLRELVRGGLPRGGLFYDLGCGVGANLPVLRALGPTVGVDASARAVAYCRSRGFDDVRVGRVDTLEDLPSGSASLVLLADVIEHLDDDSRCLRGARTLLAPGGALVVTVPAYRFLWGPNDDVSHHKRRYTARSLGRVVSPHFRIERLTYFNTLLFAPIAAGRLAQKVLPVSGGEEASVPPAPINAVLRRVFQTERHLLSRTRLPFGVSILCVGKRQ